MIKKLTIRNFQGHKKRIINLDRYVTVLIGKSDAGKSAVIRSLRWVLLNKSPKQFIRRGASHCFVELDIDGVLLRRSAGKGGNVYVLRGRKRFKVVGRNIPSDVHRLSNISEINFQRQHESSFWFDLSPGKVAKELNKLVDLESIDFIQETVIKRIREKKAELAVCQKRLDAASQSVRQLSWVRQFDAVLSRLESSYLGFAATSHHLTRIATLAGLAAQNHTRHRAATAGLSVAHSAHRKMSEFERAAERCRAINGLAGQLRNAEQRLAVKIPDIESVESLVEKHRKAKKRYKQILSLSKLLKQKQKELCQCHVKIAKQSEKIEKELRGFCPLCGNILTTTTILY